MPFSTDDIRYLFELASNDSDIVEQYNENHIDISVPNANKRWVLSNVAELLSVMGMLVHFNEHDSVISVEI